MIRRKDMHNNRYDRGQAQKAEKRSARNSRIPWSAIALAFLFMFNPYISIVDPLPDVIGYIILCCSLVKLSMLSEGIAQARRAFEKMILIDGAKLLALVWVFGIDVASERNSSLLLWSFVFGLAEVAFLAPSFVKLFDGFGELGNFHVNTSIHGSKYVDGKSHTEKLKSLSVFFVVFRAIMTLLPELASLSSVSALQNANVIDLYRYIGVMRGFCFIPALFVGICWLVRAIRYIARIRRDTVFCESVATAYREKVIPKEGIFVIRNVKIATWLFVAAMALTIDIKLDEVNILPDILVIGALLPAFIYLSKSTSINKKGILISTVLYAVTSILTVMTRVYYEETYFVYGAIARSADALGAYLVYVGSVALHGIVLICLLGAWCAAYRRVIEAHTGYVRGKEIESEGERARIAEVHKELGKGFSLMVDVAILYVISDVAYALYGAFYAFLDRNFGWLGLVNLACGVFFVAMALKALGELREAVETKYMLE
jgi:hypothetical protein